MRFIVLHSSNARPAAELLEDRTVPAVFVVVDPGDNGGVDPAPGAGTGTLRQAIVDANASPGFDTVTFAAGTGLVRIDLDAALPAIADAVAIDATTQPGYVNVPIVELNFNEADGLRIDAPDSTVRGLALFGGAEWGVRVSAARTLVAGNYVGLAADGKTAIGNGDAGLLFVDTSEDNTIGGTTAADRNVISGNAGDGVRLEGSSGNSIVGNYIGTDAIGTAAIGNESNGVSVVDEAADNTVGGPTAGQRNVISGNDGSGVSVSGGGTTGNLIVGNTIGLAADGKTATENMNGVLIDDGASENTVGGAASGAGNLISGNAQSGVYLTGVGTSGNVVSGNTVGLDADGKTAVGNLDGITADDGASDNTIGGTDPGAGNIISGNGIAGVYLFGGEDGDTTGNVVAGNTIGLAADGTTAVGNQFGVIIGGAASDNTVGGSAPGEGNLISGNAQIGVDISDLDTTGNVVAGNTIGLAADGKTPVGNGAGIFIGGGASDNTVGGPTSGQRNVISGNQVEDDTWGVWFGGAGPGNVLEGNFIGTDATGAEALPNGIGVVIDGGTTGTVVRGNVISASDGFYLEADGDGDADGAGVVIAGEGTSGNVVAGNLIGTDATGLEGLGNDGPGVAILDAAAGNTVGGTKVADRNVIADNFGAGVAIFGAGTSGNVVAGNYIGTDATGLTDLGNDYGVEVYDGAVGNSIGLPGAGNVISGNFDDGVWLSGVGTSGNVVAGNLIGTDATGAEELGNGDVCECGDVVGNGVVIEFEATDNTVGGLTPGHRNVISGNFLDGVQILGAGTTGNLVAGNYIGTDATGSEAMGNGSTDDDGEDYGFGVFIGEEGSNNTVGGDTPEHRNVISGNFLDGVAIADEGTTGNLIAGNYIGTDAAGTAALGNGYNGLSVTDGAAGNTVGGPSAEHRNVISGNRADADSWGVWFGGAGPGNVLEGNFIGTDATGAAALPNGVGVVIDEGTTDAVVRGNLISGNDGYYLDEADRGGGVVVAGAGTTGTLVEGNRIGTAANTLSALPNGIGVVVTGGATDTTVRGNLIAGNGEPIPDDEPSRPGGVEVSGVGTSRTRIVGNRIGLAADGSPLGNAGDGVYIRNGATDNTVGGTTDADRNVVSGNTRGGVRVAGAGTTGNLILGNYLGTTLDGMDSDGTQLIGVSLQEGASGNTVGGAEPGAGNLISGNSDTGVQIVRAGTTGNLVIGNVIGLAADGITPVGNGDGVLINTGAADNTVGGTELGMGNTISGNFGSGVLIADAGTTGNVVAGNTIGLAADGKTTTESSFGVVVTTGASGNTIGGTAPGAGNRIAGHSGSGVQIQDAGTSGNVVAGNVIGLAADGTVAANEFGVLVGFEATDNTVGGSAPGAGNWIAGNRKNGVILQDAGTTGNLVAGNTIGLAPGGVVTPGYGVRISRGASGNTIGGTTAAERNVISGHEIDGVILFGEGTSGNLVAGNYIGTDATGTKAVGNGFNGVSVYNGASANTIGGPTAGHRNLISGNRIVPDTWGVLVTNSSVGNVVEGNYIGTDVTGTKALPNGVGVVIHKAATGTVVRGNLISGNDGYYLDSKANDGGGVVIAGEGTSGNLISGNRIGTTADGSAALPNTPAGVQVRDGATANTVGPGDLASANVISGNAGPGVVFTGAGTSGNVLGTNYVGTDKAGTVAIPNAGHGVHVGPDATGNRVGSLAEDAGNLISGNAGDGVRVDGSGNTVEGNYIGLDDAGGKALPNAGAGIVLVGNDNLVTAKYDTTGFRQVIAGNRGDGVLITGTGNVVIGNLIGTDRLGAAAVPNGGWGVRVTGADNRVGGPGDLEGNLVSGNAKGGALIQGPRTNFVANYVGTDVAGVKAVGNAGPGVRVVSADNTIGGRLPDRAAVLVSGNAGDGVVLAGPGATGNQVLGGSFGTDKTASFALPNGGAGIRLDGATGNTVGGLLENSDNFISGNAGAGIVLENGANNNRVARVNVGTDLSGMKAVPNEGVGVLVRASFGNTIGGPEEGAQVVASGNRGAGVLLTAGSSGNLVTGNQIGLAGVGNGGAGVAVAGSARNTVTGNAIEGNAGAGVAVGSSPADVAATRNAVLGNAISGNAGIPIDLGSDGPTPNGTNPRAFPNAGQNYPVLTGVVADATRAAVTGTLTTAVGTYRLEFFVDSAFLGSLDVTADATGVARFTFLTSTPVALADGAMVTATATGATGSSEVSAPAPVVRVEVTPETLQNAAVGSPYRVEVSGSDSEGLRFAVSAGLLPPGLTLSQGGVLAGTPTVAGAFPFVITATDGNGITGSRPYTLTVAPAIVLDPSVLPGGTIRIGYATKLTATGGTGPFTFGVTVGTAPPGLTLAADGTLIGFPTAAGDFRFTVTATDAAGNAANREYVLAVTVVTTGRRIAAPVGDTMTVRVTGPDGVAFEFTPFEAEFTGGLTLSTADVTGDGVDDVIVGAGPGGGPRVVVFDGVSGGEVASFFAFESTFTGGVTVAAADTNWDGRAEVVVGAGPGGGPRVAVFEGLSGVERASFWAFEQGFSGGVFVAAGDLDGDGRAEVIAGSGPGGGPHVQVFRGNGQSVVSFFAADPANVGEVQVGYAPRPGGGLILTTTATTGPRGWALTDGAVLPADLLGVEVG